MYAMALYLWMNHVVETYKHGLQRIVVGSVKQWSNVAGKMPALDCVEEYDSIVSSPSGYAP